MLGVICAKKSHATDLHYSSRQEIGEKSKGGELTGRPEHEEEKRPASRGEAQ